MKPLRSVLSAGFCACLLFVTSQASRANVIQPTSTLPPTVGGYVFPTFCATGPHGISACVENGFISGFFGLTTTYVTTPSVAEEVDGKASFTADLFNDVGVRPEQYFSGLYRVRLTSVSVLRDAHLPYRQAHSPPQSRNLILQAV